MSVNDELKENKSKKLDYEPSHLMTGQYAILMETNGEENESWMYFIRVEGNEENLKFLSDQLEEIDWCILDDLSCFDLEMDHFVSATTAKEMTKVDLNHTSFHRKFDGKLQRIDFNFKRKDSNEKKICRVFDKLGFGQIEDYIDDEDLDEEDLCSEVSSSESEEDDEDKDVSMDSYSSSSSSDDDDDDDNDEDRDKKVNNKMKLPPSLIRKKNI